MIVAVEGVVQIGVEGQPRGQALRPAQVDHGEPGHRLLAVGRGLAAAGRLHMRRQGGGVAGQPRHAQIGPVARRVGGDQSRRAQGGVEIAIRHRGDPGVADRRLHAQVQPLVGRRADVLRLADAGGGGGDTLDRVLDRIPIHRGVVLHPAQHHPGDADFAVERLFRPQRRIGDGLAQAVGIHLLDAGKTGLPPDARAQLGVRRELVPPDDLRIVRSYARAGGHRPDLGLRLVGVLLGLIEAVLVAAVAEGEGVRRRGLVGILEAQRVGVRLEMQPRRLVRLRLGGEVGLAVHVLLVEQSEFEEVLRAQRLAEFDRGAVGKIAVLAIEGVRFLGRVVAGVVERDQFVVEGVVVEPSLEVTRAEGGVADVVVALLVPLRPLPVAHRLAGDLGVHGVRRRVFVRVDGVEAQRIVVGGVGGEAHFQVGVDVVAGGVEPVAPRLRRHRLERRGQRKTVATGAGHAALHIPAAVDTAAQLHRQIVAVQPVLVGGEAAGDAAFEFFARGLGDEVDRAAHIVRPVHQGAQPFGHDDFGQAGRQ